MKPAGRDWNVNENGWREARINNKASPTGAPVGEDTKCGVSMPHHGSNQVWLASAT